RGGACEGGSQNSLGGHARRGRTGTRMVARSPVIFRHESPLHSRATLTISSGRSPCRSWPRGLVSPTLTWPTRAGRRASSACSRSEDLERRARHPTPPTVEGIGLLFLLPFCSHNTPKQGGPRRRTTHHQTTWNRLLPNDFPARLEGYRSWPSCTHNPKVVGSN